LAQSVVSLCVIERWFHFTPHLCTTLPWEITEHKKWPDGRTGDSI